MFGLSTIAMEAIAAAVVALLIFGESVQQYVSAHLFKFAVTALFVAAGSCIGVGILLAVAAIASARHFKKTEWDIIEESPEDV